MEKKLYSIFNYKRIKRFLFKKKSFERNNRWLADRLNLNWSLFWPSPSGLSWSRNCVLRILQNIKLLAASIHVSIMFGLIIDYHERKTKKWCKKKNFKKRKKINFLTIFSLIFGLKEKKNLQKNHFNFHHFLTYIVDEGFVKKFSTVIENIFIFSIVFSFT